MIGLITAYWLGKRKGKKERPTVEVTVISEGESLPPIKKRRKKWGFAFGVPLLLGLWLLGFTLDHQGPPRLSLSSARAYVTETLPSKQIQCHRETKNEASCYAVGVYGCRLFTLANDKGDTVIVNDRKCWRKQA